MRKEEIMKKAVEIWFSDREQMSRSDYGYLTMLSSELGKDPVVLRPTPVDPDMFKKKGGSKYPMRPPSEANLGLNKKYNVYIRREWNDKISELLKVGETEKTTVYLVAQSGLTMTPVLATLDYLRSAGTIKTVRRSHQTMYKWLG